MTNKNSLQAAIESFTQTTVAYNAWLLGDVPEDAVSELTSTRTSKATRQRLLGGGISPEELTKKADEELQARLKRHFKEAIDEDVNLQTRTNQETIEEYIRYFTPEPLLEFRSEYDVSKNEIIINSLTLEGADQLSNKNIAYVAQCTSEHVRQRRKGYKKGGINNNFSNLQDAKLHRRLADVYESLYDVQISPVNVGGVQTASMEMGQQNLIKKGESKREGTVLAQLLHEIEQEEVSNTQVETLASALADHIEPDRKIKARIEQVESDLNDIRPYIGPLQDFLSEEGTSRDIRDKQHRLEERIGELRTQIKTVQTELDEVTKHLEERDDVDQELERHISSLTDTVDGLVEWREQIAEISE